MANEVWDAWIWACILYKQLLSHKLQTPSFSRDIADAHTNTCTRTHADKGRTERFQFITNSQHPASHTFMQ